MGDRAREETPPPEFRDKTFEDETVHLDGNAYIGCTFVECRLIFSGLGRVRFVVCRFDGCRGEMEGAAQETLGFLAKLCAIPGMEDFMEKTFDNIRGRDDSEPWRS